MKPFTTTVNTRHGVIASLLVGVAMIAGGGGSPSPFPEMVVQLTCAALLAIWLVMTPAGMQNGRGLLVAGLLLILPVVQLIPLPPGLWHALPGRELERASLALVGADESWRPLTVTPSRTLAALLALVPPAVILFMTAALRRSGRAMVIGMIAGVSFLSLLVGAAQMSAGEGNAFRFYVADVGYLNGFQANHNSAADVLLIGILAFTAAVKEWCDRRHPRTLHRYRLFTIAAGVILLSLGVFLTASRAGTMLLPVAWLWVSAMIWPWLKLPPRKIMAAGLGAIAVLVFGGLWVSHSAVFGKIVARYNFEGEFRPQLWTDALYAAQQYFPFGAGMGSFVPVFLAAERLEVVDTTVPNRAHNDFLELAVEGGIFGYIVMAAISAILLRHVWRSLRERGARSRTQNQFALATFSIIVLHSQVDYPLRSISLACIAAAAAGLLLPVKNTADDPRES